MADGTVQQVSAEHAARAGERFDADVAYAEKAEEHVWVWIVAHRLSPDAAREAASGGGDAVLLDLESLALSAPGCYRCEEPLTRRLLGKRCRGPR